MDPAPEPDFESLFQEQDMNPDNDFELYQEHTENGGHADGQEAGSKGWKQHHGDQGRRDPVQMGETRDVQQDGTSRQNPFSNIRLKQEEPPHLGRDGDAVDQAYQWIQNHHHIPGPGNGDHHHHSATQPPQEGLLRAWQMVQASPGSYSMFHNQTSNHQSPQQQMPTPFNPHVTPPPSSRHHPNQGYPFSTPFPTVDPMNYRSPGRDRASPSPQPSPGFYPTHSSHNSLAHSLSPRFGPSDNCNPDPAQMGLSAPFSIGGPNRRLSAAGQEGARTPSYAGSVFSGSGLGELEDRFAGGWGHASDNGGGGAGSYAPSTHGQGQYQDFDFSFDSLVADGEGGAAGTGQVDPNMHQRFPLQRADSGAYLSQGQGWDASGSNGLEGFQNQPAVVDDGYMRQRIADYIASTRGVQAGHPGDPAVLFTEPIAYDNLALLTGSGPLQTESLDFAAQQIAQVGQADQIASQSGVFPRGVVEEAMGNRGISEFARRMNSLTSDRSMSTSSNNTPAEPNFPSVISGDPRSGDGIIMPPFPVNPEVSLAERRQITSTRKRSQGPDTPQYTPNFIRPSPPIGRAALARQPHLQDNLPKPPSPPQLVIPDHSAGSGSTDGGDSGFQPYPHQQSTSGLRAVSSLVPPSNGLLGIPPGGNGLTGPYMSPIGPHGPSINIVPSTPTSALREGSRNQGIWENLAAQARPHSTHAAQQSHPPAQQEHWDPMRMVVVAPGFPGAYGNEGPRRNSLAGVYASHAPAQLSLAQTGGLPNQPNGPPSTAPIWQTALIDREMAARQRSRSETHLSSMSLPDRLNLQAVQQAIYLQAMGHPTGGCLEANEAGGSALEMDEFMASQVAGPSFNAGPANRMAYGAHQSHRASKSHAEFRHIVPGPEAFGANMIITNDGRSVPFNHPSAWTPQSRQSQANHRQKPSFGSSTGSVEMDPGEVDAMILALADASNLSAPAAPIAPSDPGGNRTPAPRVVQKEDMADRTGRKRKIIYTPSPEPQRVQLNPADGSLLPPRLDFSPRIAKARDASPYSRPGESGGRRGSIASSIGSTSMRREASGSSSKGGGKKVMGKSREPARSKVTTEATEMASKTRRTSDGHFVCPIAGCGSTFTRQFNLKGHIRSHNEERPFVCPFDGCNKSFARAHDCKRHQQLHVGVKPFQCEGCTRMFARLDALSRHHKTDSGVECARIHPLPTNLDGTLLTETKYKAEMARRRSSTSAGPSASDEQSPEGLTPLTSGDTDAEMEDVKPLIVKKESKKGRKGSVLM